jgi:copper chaperone CopZ
MMAEKTIRFMFNTPISGVSKEAGKYDVEIHTSLVLPIRGEFMQIDGVSGCRIDRFGFYVEYFDEMTDSNTVIEAVLGIIAEFGKRPTESGYFPLRGEKTPSASPVLDKPVIWRFKRVGVSMDSLTDYVTVGDDPNKFDDAEFSRRVKPLAGKLGDANGVTEVKVAMTQVEVSFDSRITSFDQIRDHIMKSLNSVRGSEYFFPHVTEGAELKTRIQYWDLTTPGTSEK